MTLDSSLVRVAVTGGVYVDLDGAGTVPTTAVATIPVAFDDVGYIGEDGVSQSIGQDITDIKAWQNGDVVRRVQTSHTVSYSFTMIESNGVSLEAYYGNYDGGHVELTGDSRPRLPWIIDVLDGDEKIRICIPDGEISEVGDTAFKNGEAIGYPVTITAYPVDGVKAHIYYGDLASS